MLSTKIGSSWRSMSRAPRKPAKSSNPLAKPQPHTRSGNSSSRPKGPRSSATWSSSGRKVFLDLKYHDIPNTVAAAVKSAAELGVSMLTVHASGGSKMLRAAVEAASQSPAKPMVLAVTVLTSLSDSDLQEIGDCRKHAEPGASPGSAGSQRRLWRLGRLRPRGSRAAHGSGRGLRHRDSRSASGRGRSWRSGPRGDSDRMPSPRGLPIWWLAGRSWKLRTQQKLPSKLRLKSKKPAGKKQSASEAEPGLAGAQYSLRLLMV